MTKLSPIVFAVVLWPSAAFAAFTDFEDLQPGDTFFAGETVVSNGIEFIGEDFSSQGFTGPVIFVGNKILSSGTDGFHLAVGGAEVSIPKGISHVSMTYSANEFGSPLMSIVVNGIVSPVVEEFSPLDGLTFGSVDVSVAPVVNPEEYAAGTLTLSGPVESLAIRGLELSIDNVRLGVPEPSASTLLALCLMATLGNWRHRSCPIPARRVEHSICIK